ncbi:MAG: HAMP domain-containing sensor histidine kinase [Actinomycetota bacterium]|nr:HAMP domain-containing sensor histidine kinase [Actinomycetota bacterium]
MSILRQSWGYPHFEGNALLEPPPEAPGVSETPGGDAPVAPGGNDRAAQGDKAYPRRWRPGTAGRLALFHALVVTAVLSIVVVQFVQAFAGYYHTSMKRDLVEEVAEFSTAASSRPATQSVVSFVHDYLETHVLAAGHTLIIAVPGSPVLGTTGSKPIVTSATVKGWLAKPPRSTVVRQMDIGGSSQEVLATSIRQGGRTIGTFVATASLAALQTERQRVLALAFGEAAITLIAGVTSVYLLLRRLLRTVGRVTRTAAEIAHGGDLERRLGDQGTDDEVGEMAATFDAMIEKVDSTMSAQRRLLADVSHQLRTPLTVARGHLEVLGRGGLDDPDEVSETVTVVVDELDHMRSLVERLLLLGHALEPDFLEPEPVDLRAFLLDLVEAGEVLARRNWSMGPIPDVVMSVDPAKLRGAILNLVDNAVKATRDGDAIRLSARLAGSEDPREGGVWLLVEDSGPGIPPEDRPAALARFARPGTSSYRGTGLGLAIVAAVAQSHGGTVHIDDSPLGGCRVSLFVPGGRITQVGPVSMLAAHDQTVGSRKER